MKASSAALKVTAILAGAQAANKRKSTLQSQDDRAERAAELKRQVTSMQTELAQLESELRDSALAQLMEAEQSGVICSTVDYGSCRVTRQNRGRALDPETAGALKPVLGAQLWRQLLQEETSAKVRPAMVGALLERLGDDAASFLDVGTSYKICSGYIDARAKLRPTLGDAKNQALDALSGSLLVAPSVVYK